MSAAATDLDRTRAHQRDASDPRASAWVIANAGAGKTHVLTQRVIRLLLAGTDPAAILCLTFTKVAAAEMSRRVFQTLGEWTMLDEMKLAEVVSALEGRAPTEDEMRQARRLFAKALETPGGLKIQTIHAFCERLLHEFPFEANVPGQFAVMDDSAAAAALAAARADIMALAATDREPRLRDALRLLAKNYNDDQIRQALDALIGKRDKFRRWMQNAAASAEAGNVDDALADLRARLGLAADENEESVCREVSDAANWTRDHCRDLIGRLRTSSNKTDQGAGRDLLPVVEAGDSVAEAARRIDFFLTKDGSAGLKARSAPHRFGAATRNAHGNLETNFADEAERLLALVGRLNAVRAFETTEALLVVGDAILQAYHQTKRQAGALDFDDLIVKTRNLLSRSDAAQWVLYKLDRRVDHILVDEAQDTSPDQWMVVKAIAEDFFSGEGASRVPRTIFAVGDDKQSIFRFQGAAPAMLAEMQRFFKKKVEDAQESFARVPLSLSFRSTQEVLLAVDAVFETDEFKNSVTQSGYEAHSTNRPHEPGHIVLLPRTVRRSKEEPEDWTEPYTAPSAAETELAERIADEILRIEGTVLPSGKRLTAGEILVLVRRRDAFAAAMNRALLKRQIPTAGADRIPVSTHIAVLDLLALADVMLLPEDDLQLAALLKSPLLGLREEELMQLAVGRERRTLWSALLDQTDERFASVATRLRSWRKMADQVTPFRFFATVLGPEQGRKRFRARLGGEADDVLDTFLSQALTYETTEPPSLQGFVRFVRANERDIKRETDEAASGVRVMTVHGAKGLEADVVFLADTGGAAVVPQLRDILVDIGTDRDDPAFLWRRNAAEQPEVQRDADAREDTETEKEYLRLLYVAMTRARDVLYVAGVRLIKAPPRNWYTIVRGALVPDSAARDEDDELVAPFQWPEAPRPPLGKETGESSAASAAEEPPAWLHRVAPTPVLPPQPLRPSLGLGEPDPLPAAAPARQVAPGDDALRRGRLVHLLLQFLPEFSPDERAKAAERLVAGELGDDPASLAALLGEANAVLSHSALKGLFTAESRAEVAIVGNVETERGTYAVSGRIDRLVRDLAGFRLFDFKTDRAVPASAAKVDPGYVLQMALYRKLLMEMEPGTPVEATLIYTAGPNVMPIPPEMMERALAELGVRVNPVP